MRFEDDRKPQRPQYYFQVTSIPESEAPLEYCKAFVGKVFPLMPRNMDGPESMTARESESGLLVNIADAVAVEIRHVIDVLRAAGEDQAADYWAARSFDNIVFQRSEVRIFLPHQSDTAGE